jgi:hypothetical protein
VRAPEDGRPVRRRRLLHRRGHGVVVRSSGLICWAHARI